MNKLKKLVNENKIVVTCATSISTLGALTSNAFATGELDTITSSMTGVFDSVKTAGVTLVTAAIALGVIFIGAKWLWGKTKQWLAKV